MYAVEGDALVAIDAFGFPADPRVHRVPLTPASPLGDAVLRCAPVFVESFEDYLAMYPASDRLRIEQVITNLLVNALKYGQGKPIKIAVGREGALAVIAIRDQGIGIEPAEQTRIFQRFERAVSSRAFGGLGLGLWITQQIVDVHGGRLSVESAPGRGSTFRVELPATQ